MKNQLVILGIISILIVGCKSTAFVTCNNIDKFESRSGVINTPFLDMGDVVILDTLNKTGFFIGHVDVLDSDINTTEPIDTFEIISKTDFSISLSGKISKNQGAAVTAKNSINNSSTFFLKNSARKSIKDPISNFKSSELKNVVLETLKEGDNSIVLFVSSLVYADKIQLKLSKEVSSSVDADVVEIGNISVKINYNCNDALEAISNRTEGAGMFFKSTFFGLNKDETDLLFLTQSISLGAFEMTQGITK